MIRRIYIFLKLFISAACVHALTPKTSLKLLKVNCHNHKPAKTVNTIQYLKFLTKERTDFYSIQANIKQHSKEVYSVQQQPSDTDRIQFLHKARLSMEKMSIISYKYEKEGR